MDTAPQQPDIPEATGEHAKERRIAIQAHRKAVLDWARLHPGEWVTYWTSPTLATARHVKRGMKKFTVGSYPLSDRQYVMHGQQMEEGWSLRLEGNSTQVRFNGPWAVGQTVVPEWE